MQRMKRTAAALMVTVMGAFVLSSCKESTIINSNAVPDVDNINTFQLPDTVTVVTRTVFDDSVVTGYKDLATFYQSAGSVNTDPFFGRTHTATYFQVIPPTTSFAFSGTNPQIDSAVLVLPYGGFTWGDTTFATPAQTLRVFPVNEEMFRDTAYYSKQRVSVDRSQQLGSAVMYPKGLKDSVHVMGVSTQPHMRIRLDTGRLMPLLRKGIDSSASHPAFLKQFPGLYVEPDTTQIASALPYFYIAGSGFYDRAGVVFYYHNNTDDSLVTSFSFNATYCAHYTFVKRDYSGTPAFNLISPSAPANPNVLLVQNEPGAAIDFRMPFVKSLPANAVINKAQIILTQIDTSSSSVFFGPSRIFPIGINENGGTYDIADRYPLDATEPIGFIDGTRRSVTVGSVTVNQYTINFPRELEQAIIGQKNELHLRINGTQTYPAAYRLIAGGRTHGNWKLKLNIIYSKP